MTTERWLIDAKPLMKNGWHLVQTGESNRFLRSMSLADVPSVDVVEVMHGRWVMDDYTHRYRCSVCEAYQPYDTVGDYIDYWDCDYCPICGAKMEGE